MNSKIEQELVDDYNYQSMTTREVYLKKINLVDQLLNGRTYLEKIPPSSNNQSIPTHMEGFVQYLYDNRIVDLSEVTRQFTDKLFTWNLFVHYLGKEKALSFHPYSMGLKEFLEKHSLLNENGEIIQDKERFKNSLSQEFPKGILVKPNTSYNSMGKSNFYFSIDHFLNHFFKNLKGFYSPEYRLKQYKFIEGAYSTWTPELFLIQENLGFTDESQERITEVRVHSYQNKVVKNATAERWDRFDRLNPEKKLKAEAFIQTLLSLLPEKLLSLQAWSYDIGVNGDTFKLIEVNTNRGSHSDHWSSFLRRPKELSAHTSHLRDHYGLNITGLSKWAYKWGLANYFQWWRRLVKKTKKNKKLARLIPPWPFIK